MSTHHASRFALALFPVLVTGACDLAQPFQGPGFDGQEVTTEATGPFVAATTHLVLKAGDDAAAGVFDEQMKKLNAALETQPGFIGSSLSAKLLSSPGEYRTLSVWEDEEAMLAWVVGEAHAEAMEAMTDHVETGRTVSWTLTRDEMPPTWQDAKARLDEDGHEAY